MTVVERIKKYLKEHYPDYELTLVIKLGDTVYDRNLYMAAAMNIDGSFAAWEKWDNLFPCLEGGHFGLASTEECVKILYEYKKKYNERTVNSNG